MANRRLTIKKRENVGLRSSESDQYGISSLPSGRAPESLSSVSGGPALSADGEAALADRAEPGRAAEVRPRERRRRRLGLVVAGAAVPPFISEPKRVTTYVPLRRSVSSSSSPSFWASSRSSLNVR